MQRFICWPFGSVQTSSTFPIKKEGMVPSHPRELTLSEYDDDVDEIVFGIGTDPQVESLITRALVIKETWATRFRQVLWFSAPVPEGHPSRLQLSTRFITPNPSDPYLGTKFGGAWLALPILREMYRYNPRAKWYFVADDDTFLVPRNTMCVIRMHDPTQLVYKGWPTIAIRKNITRDFAMKHRLLAVGGPGYFLSNALVKRLFPLIDSCITRHVQWASDIRMGACITELLEQTDPNRPYHLLHGKEVRMHGFHHISMELELDERKKIGKMDAVVVTNHRTTPLNCMHIWRAIQDIEGQGLVVTWERLPPLLENRTKGPMSTWDDVTKKNHSTWISQGSTLLEGPRASVRTCLNAQYHLT